VDPKSVTRKLRAILSADVQGYSRLMGDDEIATVETITEYRETFSSIVTQWKGRVVDSPGDNILSEFASVVDAVQCAVEIQKVLKAKNEELPENRRMIFRIGVNLGDVIHEGDRIYGDGVNIAARIESLADGGGICISGSAYEQIENKLALGYDFIGEHSVKNIAKPIRVYKVPMGPDDVGKKEAKPKLAKNAAIAVAVVMILGIAAAAIWSFYPSSEKAPVVTTSGKASLLSTDKASLPLPDKPSIAVLPFTNISGDPKEDYLSDGITEQIITALSKTPRLFVIARNSTFAFKGKSVNVSQIGRELGVRYVLEGSVQKSGNRIRITAQLIDAKTGTHLWAEKYDKELKDIFVLQDEITLSVLSALQVHLGDGEDARLWARGTKNLEAYIKFLQGLRYYHQHADKENYLVKAPKMFEEAIALDPQFPTPYFMLAMIHRWAPFYNPKIDPKQAMVRATEFLQKGMKLDSSDPLAHSALGLIYQAQGKHQKAIFEAEKAVSFEPNMAEAYWLLGVNLHYVGRYEEAVAQIKKAIRLNPIPPPYYHMFLGNAYQLMGKYDDSIAAYKKAIQISPNYMFPRMRLAISYGLIGLEKDAHAEAKEVLRINPKFSGEHFLKVASYKDKVAKDLLREGLRKAGLLKKPPSPIPEKPSIAVLPFSNIAGDPKEQYLCDGFTEQIITVLAKTPGLPVTASNTSFTYKGQPVNVQQVGKDLKVRYVLEGSVQKSGDRIRVTAQLIDTATGNHLWAEKYDRDLKDIFDIQDDISLKIMKSLQMKLVGGTGLSPCARGTNNVGAYLKFLQATHFFNVGTVETLYLARQAGQEAIALDPDFGAAYGSLAETYLAEIPFCVSKSPEKSVARAYELAKKGLNANNSCPYSRLVMGIVYMYMGQYDKGMENMRAAIDMEPNWSHGYAVLAVYSADPIESIELIKKALRLNPLPPPLFFNFLGFAYARAGMFEEAITAYKMALQRAPDYFWSHWGLAIVYAILGREEDAHFEVHEILKINPHFSSACMASFIEWYKDEDVRKKITEWIRKAGLK